MPAAIVIDAVKALRTDFEKWVWVNGKLLHVLPLQNASESTITIYLTTFVVFRRCCAFLPIPCQHLLGIAARIADHDAVAGGAGIAHIAAAAGADLELIDGLLA